MQKVYNKRRPNEIPANAVYVGRPTVWGNPFSKGSKDQNIADFEKYARKRLTQEPKWLDPLKGKDLVCWCSPAGCHGDILVKLANAEPHDCSEHGVRVTVTGGRDFRDKQTVFDALDLIHADREISLLIHGGARGADSLAGQWAKARRVPVKVFLPDWKKFGKRAGILRNQVMLDQSPDLVVAFPGGRGTAHMVGASKSQGFEVVDAQQLILNDWANHNAPEDIFIDSPSEWELIHGLV